MAQQNRTATPERTEAKVTSQILQAKYSTYSYM